MCYSSRTFENGPVKEDIAMIVTRLLPTVVFTLFGTLLIAASARCQSSQAVNSASVPNVTVSTDTIFVGITYDVSGTTTTDKTQEAENIASRSVVNKNDRLDSFVRTTKAHVSGDLQAGLAKGNLSFGASLSADYDDQTITEYSNKSSVDETRSESSKLTDLTQRKSKNEISFGADSGYILTRLVIKNSTGKLVTVKDIDYEIYGILPCSTGGESVMSLGGGEKLQRVDLVTGALQPGAKIKIGPPRDLNVEVPAREYSVQVYFPEIRTDRVLDLIQSRVQLRVKINSFRVVVDGKETLMTNGSSDANRIELIVSDAQGRVSATWLATNPNGSSLSAKDVISQKAKVVFAKNGENEVILRLNGKNADFSQWTADTRSDGTKGTWVVLSDAPDWRNLSDPVHGGNKILVSWLTTTELASNSRTELRIPRERANVGHDELTAPVESLSLGSPLIPVSCLGDVQKGDVVRLIIGGRSLTYTPRIKNLCSAPSQATLNYVDEHSTVIDSDASGIAQYNILLSFDLGNEQKKLIPLSEIVDSCSFRKFRDGRVEVSFVVDDDLLPEESGKLCFLSPMTKHSFFSGLWINHNPLSLCGAYNMGPAEGHTENYYDHNELTIIANVARSGVK